MDSETPTAIPRLRVSRQHQSAAFGYSGSPLFSEAGPSRLHSSSTLPLDQYIDDVADDEQQDTPKLPAISTLPPESSSMLPEYTPAARLKAVLERTSARYKPPPAPTPSSAAVSEFESDFEIPTTGSSQPSLARENLNSLFSHALREPGDTPQKSAKGSKLGRRNSFDTSEFESSPRAIKMKKDRIDYKGKRRSMSDDELSSSNGELQSISSQFSAELTGWLVSTSRSQAVIFNSLRQRLDSSGRHGQKSNSSEHTSTQADEPNESLDTLQSLKDLDPSQFSPPAATSTPQHSLKISVNSPFQSNLMDQDSEMQQAMKDLDSYDSSSNRTFQFFDESSVLVNIRLCAGPSRSLDALRLSKDASAESVEKSNLSHRSGSSRSGHPKKTDVLSSPRADSFEASSQSREHDRERERDKHPFGNATRLHTEASSLMLRPLSRNGSRKSFQDDDSVSSHDDCAYLLCV
ncbi:hypothetical protein GYMLUDRAFT_622625 [Collybiopsis luxurians FD-317 M1]|nr:hypothetical protein GYMLUDRAFT_622625 [Collybiopsis luxurians FD-317 M1]